MSCLAAGWMTNSFDLGKGRNCSSDCPVQTGSGPSQTQVSFVPAVVKRPKREAGIYIFCVKIKNAYSFLIFED